jgi:vacuolar-type H+-ATPase subunit C/Vma6
MAIDTLAFVKVLEAAGVPREQAEAQVVALAQHALADLATKDDVDEVREDIAALRSEVATKTEATTVKSEIAALRTEMATKADLAEMKYELTWRLFGLMLGISGLMNGILFALLRLTHTQ